MNTILLLTLFCLTPSLAMTQAQPTPAGESATGIEGTISIAPVQGGPARQGAPDSKALARMAFEVKQDGRVVHSFQTDDQGHFRVPLNPGHYTIVRKDWSSAVGLYGPFEVDAAQGEMKAVAWVCDSGLR